MTPTALPPPLLRALFATRGNDNRLQRVLEHLPMAALLVVPRTGSLVAFNGRAAALTEWSRDELARMLLSEVVTAPAAAEALEAIHDLAPGETRSVPAVPLRTRSGRPAVVDLRLSAWAEPPSRDVLVLVLATPADERLAQERGAAEQGRAFDCLDKLLALLVEPDEARLTEATELIRDMLGADAAGLYRMSPSQPGIRLQAHAAAPHVAPPAKTFPPLLAPAEGLFLESPMRWASPQRVEGYLHQAARAAGWAVLLSHPIGDPPATVGAICVAYRPGTSPPAPAARLLALAAQHLHQLIALVGRQSNFERARDLAVRLTAQAAAVNAQIDEGVLLLNRRATLDEINSAAARILGYRSEEVVGLPFGDVLIGDEPLDTHVRRLLDLPEAVFSHECRLLRRGGEVFPAVLRGHALPMGGAVLTVRDLSDVRATAVLREHADQLAFIGEAAPAFAHEVRAPLNNITMGVQYLAARLGGDESLSGALGKIQVECERLSGLMNDMLAWARPVDPALVPTDLGALLKRVLQRFALKIDRRNARLTFTVEPDCPRVLADARLLEQVFFNLIDNALQAMPAGGQLSVTLCTTGRGGPGGPAMLEARVHDTGPGISEDARKHVFDPYFTTKPDGTGLGLAICKRLVTVHRGAIRVDSFPDSGTAFTVTLPIYQPPTTASENA